MNLLFYTLFTLGIFTLLSHPANAYLDPGSGSLLFQLIVGGILSGLFAIKLYFKKIKSFFAKKNIQGDEQKKD
ncbi:hypothetical protein C4588_05475 [Candidatus Parcubacteria bacterium]|nr:MAG: hypothetical protein C4588_05475 [Candidatus Parcubacteria bacterium]